MRIFSDQDLFHSFSQLGSIIGFSAEPQTISDCVIKGGAVEGTSLTGVSPGMKNGWRLNNISFIDTKHPQGIITNLPPGVYTGCKFENSGTISFVTKRLKQNMNLMDVHLVGMRIIFYC